MENAEGKNRTVREQPQEQTGDNLNESHRGKESNRNSEY